MAALGPTLTVDTPTRSPLRGGLLAVANVIEATDVHAGNGINYLANPAATPPVLAPGLCWPLAGTSAAASMATTGIASVSTDPFALYYGVECGLLYSDDYNARALEGLSFNEGYGVEKVVDSVLFAAARAAAPVAAVSMVAALAKLEKIATIGQLTLHADRELSTFMLAKDLLEADGEYVLHSQQGSPLANGGGYLTAGPTAGKFWLYATGQVNIWRGAPVASAAQNPAYSRAMAIAERIYSITLDGSITAVLVDITL